MQTADAIKRDLLAVLACPRDRSELQFDGGGLRCVHGHHYPVVDGIPVFLLGEKDQTIGIASASLRAAESGIGGPLYLETLGISDAQKRAVESDWHAGNGIDPAISYLIGATSGWGYVKLIGRLHVYPIPDIPLERSGGDWLLDAGSGWCRWSVSAARKGWRVAAIDPSLGALMAARRAFSATEPDIALICADARFLPFKAAVFGGAFSYSVLQHFSEPDAEAAIAEMGRVLRAGGIAKVQLAHSGGLRANVRARIDGGGGTFRVRYRPLADMRAIFERYIGPSRLLPEAYGGLGLLAEDRKYLPLKNKIVVTISWLLTRLARLIPPMIRLADSVYVVSRKT